MMRISATILTLTMLFISAVPASADGAASLKKADGTSVRIICNASACQITFFDKAGNKVKMESTDGGAYGYAVAKEKYHGLGYN